MVAHEYTNTASIAVLTIPIQPSDLSCTVTNYSGWPVPVDGVWAIIGRGTSSAEVVLITNATGSVLTIERGQGGTIPMPHNGGDTLEHIAPAEHFELLEEHNDASADVHGVTGPLVGANNPGTITNKLYRGGFVSVHSDVEPPGLAARYESVVDVAGPADGFVHRNQSSNTTARAFMAEHAGAPRFEVMNDGRVRCEAVNNPALQVSNTSQFDGPVNANAGATITGNITATGNVQAGSATVTGNATVGGTLGVTGATTLAGTTTGALTAASANVTGNASVGGNATVTGTLGVTGTTTVGTLNGSAINAATVTATGAVSGASVAATGPVTAYGGRVLVTVPSLASVTSPTADQLVCLSTDHMIYRYTGSAWVAIAHTDPSQGHALYRMSANQPIPTTAARKLYLPNALATTADVTATLGDATNGSYFTLNRAGLWLLETSVQYAAYASAAVRTAWLGDDTLTPNWGQESGMNTNFECSLLAVRRFVAGQRVATWVYHETGTTLNIVGTLDLTHFSMTWLRP